MMDDATTSQEWQPGQGVIIAWNIFGLGLLIVGIMAFSALYASTHDGESGFAFTGVEALGAILVTLLLIIALVILHEWLHGQSMRRFGATPHYGVGMATRIMPYFFCTARGHRFEKRQFLIVTLAPSVIISALCALAITLPIGGWLVLPAAVHLGGCIGDFWITGFVASKSGHMRFEDTITGVRFHRSR